MALARCPVCNFRIWPLTSFTAMQKCGRYRINSGQTAPSGLTGSAAFDPKPTPGNSYSITSSAVASSEGGTVRPSAFAVLRLIAVSNFVGVCTGRSAGFSPRRMRST